MKRKLNFLIATDYSAIATNAFRFALLFARSVKADITLVHIYKNPEVNATGSDPVKIRGYFEAVETKKLNEYSAIVVRSLHSDSDNIKITALALPGNIVRELIILSDAIHPDFIFIGTHGASGLQNILMGDHAWNIIQKTKIPVFVIPKNTTFNGVRNIALPTEYHDNEIPVIDYIFHFSKTINSSVSCFHISNNALPGSLEKELGLDFLRNAIPNEPPKNFDLTILKKENFLDAVKKFCIDKKTDCIALSNDQSFRLANIYPSFFRKTKQLSDHTSLPLLIIPSVFVASGKKYSELPLLERYTV